MNKFIDDLYENIGEKIKVWAKWILILETISVVIAGLSMLFIDGLFLIGLLTIVCGPIAAWVSTWILYAFGDLVDKVSKNESNTRAIADLLEKNKHTVKIDVPGSVHDTQPRSEVAETLNMKSEVNNDSKTVAVSVTKEGTIICPSCNFEQPDSRVVCWHCSAKFKDTQNTTHKWRCDGCGKMRTQSPCEHCGKE